MRFESLHLECREPAPVASLKLGEMKIALIIVLILVSGCCHTWEPSCRHKAIYAATVVGETHPVRIARGVVVHKDGETIKHATGQVLIKEQWRELRVDKAGNIYDVEPQANFRITEYRQVNDYYNDAHIAAFSTSRMAQNFCTKKKKELTKIAQDKFQMQAFYHVHEVDLLG